jgi:hypothetical protein
MHTLNSQDFQGWRMFFEPSKVRKEEKAARKKEKREAKKKAKAAKRRARNAGKTKEEQMGKLMRTMLKIFSEKVRLCFAIGYLTKFANWTSLSHSIPITRRMHSLPTSHSPSHFLTPLYFPQIAHSLAHLACYHHHHHHHPCNSPSKGKSEVFDSFDPLGNHQ